MNEKYMQNSQAGQLENAVETKHIRWITPAVDIYEVDDSLVLQADLPGVEEAGLDLQVSRGVLTLEALVKNDIVDTQRGFYRQFKLSDRIDADAGQADLKDGVLTLRLPKNREALPKRISVRTLH
ncbi:MAG: Hsp20/alpha crystallin family protein [Desulfuromonadales bacterium]|nr:Hsp20/alpha crystallin family protein [Desulfuromonadales bacterium]MBN2792877.1 Hsp20/alpha crystallin family protein [Desulfuromonadales bacterium]